MNIKAILKNTIYLSVIVLATMYLFKGTTSVKIQSDAIAKLPQEYMKDVQVTHFTENGKVKDKIKASFWAYLPDKKISEISAPRLSIVKSDNSFWHVNAKYGIASHPTLQSKVTKLELKDNVVVSRPETHEITPITVTTEQMYYYPGNEYVQTDKFVKMIKPGLEITGTGLEGYLDKNWVELQNDVKTTYVSSS